MAPSGRRPWKGWGVVALAVAIVAAVAFLRSSPADAPGTHPARGEAPVAAPTDSPSEPPAVGADAPAAAGAPPTADPVPYVENLVWGNIDLREAQAAMPDNLYWQWGAPTNDPDVLEAREEEKRRRNEEYGRVLSGDASEEEVDAYYDYRERLSTDYLEFAQWMQDRYGDELSDQLGSLLELSIKLNAARLLQIPTDRERSLEHSRKRAEIRAEWKRQQEEFGESAP